MPARTSRVLAGERCPSPGRARRDVPGEVVGADEQRLARRQPARRVGRHPARRLVGRPVLPHRAGAEAYEHHVAAPQLDRRRPRASSSAALTAWPSGSRSTPSAPATSSSTPRAISGGIVSAPSAVKPAEVCTAASTGMPPCSAQVLGLVAERVDVGAGVLGHHEQRRRARARLAEPRLVAAVQREHEPRLVRREGGRAGVARLLEVVGAGAAQRVSSSVSRSRASSLPWVSGRDASAQIAST